MKTKIILLLMVFALLLPGVTMAQAGLLRRAINRQIDHKIDSAADKQAKDNAAKKQQDEESGKQTGPERGLFGGKINIKHDKEYDFTGRFWSQVENYSEKEVKSSDMYTYFDPSSLNTGVEMKVTNPDTKEEGVLSKFIFDMNNRTLMMFLENGTGIISAIPDDSTLNAQAKSSRGKEAQEYVVTKTGNSKVIAGYKCDEYKVTESGQEGYANVWMTKDFKIKADKRTWGKTGVPSYYGYEGFKDMVMLSMESFDKKNKPLFKMETKEIDEHFPYKISVAGVTFMKMNFGQAGKK
jgi:hypothetical protein